MLVLSGFLVPGFGFMSFWRPEYSLSSLLRGEADNVFEAAMRAAESKSRTATFFEALGTFSLALVVGLAMVAAGMYLLRGQGPTTQAVEDRLASERESRLIELRKLESMRREGLLSRAEFLERKRYLHDY